MPYKSHLKLVAVHSDFENSLDVFLLVCILCMKKPVISSNFSTVMTKNEQNPGDKAPLTRWPD